LKEVVWNGLGDSIRGDTGVESGELMDRAMSEFADFEGAVRVAIASAKDLADRRVEKD